MDKSTDAIRSTIQCPKTRSELGASLNTGDKRLFLTTTLLINKQKSTIQTNVREDLIIRVFHLVYLLKAEREGVECTRLRLH